MEVTVRSLRSRPHSIRRDYRLSACPSRDTPAFLMLPGCGHHAGDVLERTPTFEGEQNER